MHKSYKKTIAILVTSLLIGALFILPASAEGTVPTGYMRMPINVGNNWLEDYGAISPSITNGDSSFEFKLPTAYYPPFETGRYFSVDFFSVQPSIINNYNDYYFGLKCFNTEVMSATLSFKGTDLSYEFTSDGYVDGYDYLHLELESFNFPSSEINIYIVFRKVYEGNYNIILDEFYFRSSSTGNIINNQNNNTDKIIQSQEQLQENEKNEAQGSGNSAADDVTSVMPNKSEGFMNAMQSFVGAMSTTNTDCKIKFPGIKVPALEGFFPDTELLSEQEVDISQAINLIPSAIMSLIQAITTVGLIVFCFKELYDTISEALTRRQQNE